MIGEMRSCRCCGAAHVVEPLSATNTALLVVRCACPRLGAATEAFLVATHGGAVRSKPSNWLH